MYAAIAIIIALAFGLPQASIAPHVCVRHLEVPVRYDPLARQANMQGVIVVQVRIGADGRVLQADARFVNPPYPPQNFLTENTERLVKTWTFACDGCTPNAPYGHEITFTYKLRDEERRDEGTTVVMDLPNKVLITAYRAVCDHCTIQ